MRISIIILVLGFKGLKVYSKSFVSNKFNDFAGHPPCPTCSLYVL